MENPWLLFLFLSVFHVIGAAVLANTLREFALTREKRIFAGCHLAFLTVWATLFGCLPLGIGIGFAARETGPPLLLLAQLLVWVSVFGGVLLAKPFLKQLLHPLLHPDLLLIIFGGGFLVAGVAVAAFVTQESRPVGLSVGASIVLVGGAFFGYGLWRLFRSTR